jgi:hypothetical protein
VEDLFTVVYLIICPILITQFVVLCESQRSANVRWRSLSERQPRVTLAQRAFGFATDLIIRGPMLEMLEGLVEGADSGEMGIHYRDAPFSVTNSRQ